MLLEKAAMLANFAEENDNFIDLKKQRMQGKTESASQVRIVKI
jgi:hypothetical protein